MRYSYLYGSGGKPLSYELNPYKSKTRILIAVSLCIIFIVGFITTQLVKSQSNIVQASPGPKTEQPSILSREIDKQESISKSEVESSLFKKDKKPQIDISIWLSSHNGKYSVSVYEEGDPLIESNSYDQYYMASIYKLYVAYIGYQKIDSGEWKDDESYVNDWSRTKCLDEMIRSSHNICGEKMMAEIGNPNIQSQLQSYGLENTSFNEFVTSSDDVANILIRIQKNLDLSPASTQKLKDSMLGQVYRDGLPSGFSDGWKVYDKVGFRDLDEYHDVALVESPQGKVFVISVLSSGAGSANLSDLANTIQQALVK